MTAKISLLSRMFGRTENAVIAKMYSHCIGQPLMVEPLAGEQLIGAYMMGAVDEIVHPQASAVETIAVMNISGALVSRPMPGPSGGGPQSYEVLTEEFDDLVNDPKVDAIILRLDTPGGFAAGLLDFTDRIFEARNIKPVHAVVEHMAYSAGYAIASAATKVWVTRSSGVGSVGVVLYHVDQSEANSKAGLKVTPIFAGARKIDFSPHMPISEEALKIAQAEVESHYTAFVDAVSRYRGIDAQEVRDTQAGLYTGTKAVDIGFADAIGTIHDAIGSLAAGDDAEVVEAEPTEEPDTDEPEAEATTETPVEAAVAAEAEPIDVVGLIVGAGLSMEIENALLRLKLGDEDAPVRVSHAKKVIEVCASSEQPELAIGFVKANTPIETVRNTLMENKAAQQEDIDVTLPAQGVNTRTQFPTAWDKTIEKFGGKP
ncbi:MAG TPA: S49 family peptidase [Woeseiaceae bacterium]|nr:S49 family peptidase [Woeseiaceae bacterium]